MKGSLNNGFYNNDREGRQQQHAVVVVAASATTTPRDSNSSRVRNDQLLENTMTRNHREWWHSNEAGIENQRGRSNSNSDLSYHLDDRNHSKSSPPGVEFCDIHPYAVDSSSSLSLSLSPSSAAAKKKKKPPVVAPVYVKIAPGLTARLRRVQETYACIAKDYYIPTSCVDCSSSLFCIQDANYVLCPLCKVVGRLEGGADLEYNGGVGIGFTWEYLQQFQQKLVRGRMEQQPSGRPRLHTTGDFYF